MRKKQSSATEQTVAVCLDVLRCLKTVADPMDPFCTVGSVIRALRNKDYSRLYDGSIPFPRFDDDFPVNYMAYNLLRKYPFEGPDRESKAVGKFLACEEECRLTNIRMDVLDVLSTDTWSALRWMREKIYSVLGPFNWSCILDGVRHGPGSTTRRSYEERDPYFKFSGKMETTKSCQPVIDALVRLHPLWIESITGNTSPACFFDKTDITTIVGGDIIQFVPKDAENLRSIGKPPDANIFLQLGFGTAIRNRLRRVGVNLNDQGVNQNLARTAESMGRATVDLKNASNTIATRVVKYLLPEDWYHGLATVRSPAWRFADSDEYKTYHMFSAMGNGATFEVETLIFWAITSYAVAETFCSDRTVSVYGDDIICSSYAVPRLKYWLDLFGFTLNSEKSYVSGPFRESCGKHYFRGTDVTPVYVKEPVACAARSAWFANSIARWCDRTSPCWPHIGAVSAWETALSLVKPPFDGCFIPDGVGDGGVIGYVAPDHISSDYQRGFNFEHLVEVETPLADRDPSDLAFYLRSLYRLERAPSFELATRLGPSNVSRGLWHGVLSDHGSSSILTRKTWRRVQGWVVEWPALWVH